MVWDLQVFVISFFGVGSFVQFSGWETLGLMTAVCVPDVLLLRSDVTSLCDLDFCQNAFQTSVVPIVVGQFVV